MTTDTDTTGLYTCHRFCNGSLFRFPSNYYAPWSIIPKLYMCSRCGLLYEFKTVTLSSAEYIKSLDGTS